jgi:hypothetical protein
VSLSNHERPTHFDKLSANGIEKLGTKESTQTTTIPFLVSLSNHERLTHFDKLSANGIEMLGSNKREKLRANDCMSPTKKAFK